MKDMYQPHFMIIPSQACNAECAYCFGPHKGRVMSNGTMEKIVDYMSGITDETGQNKVTVTFHGGEPLLAGHAFFKQALPVLRERFGRRGLNLGIQSNLWLLDQTFCELFKEYKVEIGTSLDGPEKITDYQRGKGYYARTLKGIRTAHSHGLKVNNIATFTPRSSGHWQEIVDFFISLGLNFSIHPSVPPLKAEPSLYTISPAEYGELLQKMLDYYIRNRHLIRVSSLDQVCRSVADVEGNVCTFRDCLGMFIAVDPEGDLYPCQRFCGHKEYSLGNIAHRPSLEEVFSHLVAKQIEQRQNRLKEACTGCDHFEYCKGGCLFNALAAEHPGKDRDPYCDAYRKNFDYIKQRLLKEMAAEVNINAVAQHPPRGKGNPLLKKGPLIELARHGRHPSQIAETAIRIVSAVELAKGPNISSATKRMFESGIVNSREKGEAMLRHLENKLTSKRGYLNNFYLYITLRCPLKCSHCYLYTDAEAGGKDESKDTGKDEMAVEHIETLIQEAKTVGFRQVIILGGEPLFHFDCHKLLESLQETRKWASPMNLVLRTNFALSFSRDMLIKISNAFDQVVVSVDGSEQTHDARRGEGTYRRVVDNLNAYRRVASEIPGAAELSLACVMSYADIQDEPGNALRKLGRHLEIKRIRFRPILPLGRARNWEKPPVREALGGYADSMEVIEYGFNPVSTCGLGRNIYIEPSGDALPCYAYRKPHTLIGNVIGQGLHEVVESDNFKDLSRHTVDTNPKCKTCDVRYLCGGACRAWGGEKTQYDPDAPPSDCKSLEKRARGLLAAAESYLEGIYLEEIGTGD
jgi:uncharacterized protein